MAAKSHVVVDSGAEDSTGHHGWKERPEGTENKAEKRKSDGLVSCEPAEKKKFSMPMTSSPAAGSANKKILMSLGKPQKPPDSNLETKGNVKLAVVNPVKMAMPSKPCKETTVSLKKTSAAVASVFNDDEDSEEEEMPPEAKMRMKNIGRNTPTAAGPNSFGKNRLGFCDRQKVLERELKKKMDSGDE